MQLTPEQDSILSAATARENILCEALAGTGKTTTIELVARALAPKRTLILAFNVKIKKDIEKRLKDLPNVKVQTANGLGAQILYRSGRKFELDKDKLYTLCMGSGLRGDDFADMRELTARARLAGIIPKGFVGKPLRPDNDETWETLCEDLDIDPVYIPLARQNLRSLYELTFKRNTIDFDDQIVLSALVFRNAPDYDVVIGDEVQDFSEMNHEQLKLFKRAQLIAVGDSHQAIYAWRGADSDSMEHIRSLRETWSAQTLSVTFRCPQRVVERQQSFVPLFRAGPDNRLGLVQSLAHWSPEPASAILCRNNAPLFRTAFRLLRRGISAQVLGTDVGRSLKRLYNKLSNYGRLTNEEVVEKAQVLMSQVPEKADQLDSLLAILESGSINGLEALQTPRRDSITLATGHRAKGLEWETVYHLEPHLIPSMHATSPSELRQEENLKYVIETRTKDKLFFVRQEGLK